MRQLDSSHRCPFHCKGPSEGSRLSIDPPSIRPCRFVSNTRPLLSTHPLIIRASVFPLVFRQVVFTTLRRRPSHLAAHSGCRHRMCAENEMTSGSAKTPTFTPSLVPPLPISETRLKSCRSIKAWLDAHTFPSSSGIVSFTLDVSFLLSLLSLWILPS